MKTYRVFVESPTAVWTGAQADLRLQRVNDTRFETPDGVVRVDEGRWRTALAYERYTWLVHNRTLTNDRNDIHAANFAQYAALPETVGRIIELGCGPFTNLRLILPGRKAKSVTLLDPLAEAYQREHPHCAYADGTLVGQDVTLIANPIEEWKTRRKYDTLVMINVIPHCRDVMHIFANIRRWLKKGGHLVIGEHPREHPAATHYDAGHPLALKAHVLEAFLEEFEEVYRNGWYFIGKKL